MISIPAREIGNLLEWYAQMVGRELWTPVSALRKLGQ
jgi:hypothetical protein